MTTEYAHDDFALAQLAGALGHTAIATRCSTRSHGWRKLYDPSVGFLRAQERRRLVPDGAFDPTRAGSTTTPRPTRGSRCWMAGIHDPDGVAEILGGRDAAIAKLDEFFDEGEGTTGRPPTSRAANFPRPYYWARQRARLNAPFLFAQLGRPDLTQQWVRWVVDTMYTDQPERRARQRRRRHDGRVVRARDARRVSDRRQRPLDPRRAAFPQARITVGGHELVIEAKGSGPHVTKVVLDGVAGHGPHLDAGAARGGTSTLTFERL